MNKFGERLRACRKKNALTQEQLGSLLGMELGDRGFSGAAVSDWERGVSKIHADNRIVLVSLVKILHLHGGVKSLTEANELLEAGNYRALNTHERELLFPEESLADPEKVKARPESLPLWASLSAISAEELRSIMVNADDGPPPAWPRVMAAILQRGTNHFTAARALTIILWIWVWLLAWALVTPHCAGRFQGGMKQLGRLPCTPSRQSLALL